MPMDLARASFSGVSMIRRPKISPPRQRMAAAASTPSGAPPLPMTAWTPLPTTAAPMAAVRSPSPISRMRAPAARMSAISGSCRLAIEHDHDQVLDLAVEAPGDLLEVVFHRGVETHRVLRLGADHQLLHVDVRRVQQSAALGRGQHGDGPRGPGGAQVRPLQGIDGDIDFRKPLFAFRAAPDALADVQHGSLVALPFPNHDAPVDRHVIEPAAHRLHRDLVGPMAVALAHRVRAGDRGLLDDVQKRVRQLLVGGAPVRGLGRRSHACTASRKAGNRHRVGLSTRYPSA